MIDILRRILLLLAVFCFLGAAFEIRLPRVNPLGLGLAALAFAQLLGVGV